MIAAPAIAIVAVMGGVIAVHLTTSSDAAGRPDTADLNYVSNAKAEFAGIPSTGNTVGWANAPVTITEFGDLRCPVCREFDSAVIPQVLQADRLNPDQVLDYYVRAPDGSVIPASTVASLKNHVVPRSINRFQQLNSSTISGASGMSQGEALQFFRDALNQVAPSGYTLDNRAIPRRPKQA